MSRQLLVTGQKTFRITIPDESRVTFGPWSPGAKESNYGDSALKGTLRIYEKGEKSSILAVFSGVTSFRDLNALGYAEQVVIEEGSTVWKDDEKGYVRESKVSQTNEWIAPVLPEPREAEMNGSHS